MEITDFQKTIYNIYLKVLAHNSNRGYKVRQNFDNLNQSLVNALQKLERFFTEQKQIDIKDFFQAGFTYRHEKYIELEYFTTYRAILAFKKTR